MVPEADIEGSGKGKKGEPIMREGRDDGLTREGEEDVREGRKKVANLFRSAFELKRSSNGPGRG